jgi:hypothetical protein
MASGTTLALQRKSLPELAFWEPARSCASAAELLGASNNSKEQQVSCWNWLRPALNHRQTGSASAHKTHTRNGNRGDYVDCADCRISKLLIPCHPEWFNSVPGHHILKRLVRASVIPGPLLVRIRGICKNVVLQLNDGQRLRATRIFFSPLSVRFGPLRGSESQLAFLPLRPCDPG